MRKYLLLMLACLISGVASAQQKITISGHIGDAETGETLIGAGVISEANNKIGAVTNNYGYYTLTISSSDYADGKLSLVYSYVGYEPVIVDIKTKKDTVVNVNLRQSLELNAAVKVARKDAGLTSTYLGAIEVPLTQIKNTPMLLGEADVLKAVQLLPGVQGGNEGFTGLYVRGGGPDENLILLDGVPIYNVDHMFGLFSVFQPEAVKKVTLYKGSFPANYGGRVSSILDIRTNDGNMKETHGNVSLGLISNKLHLEGPIIKDKLSYSISARGMLTACYAPIIKAVLDSTYANYYFYDLNGKVTWRISDKDRLYFGVYNGIDKFKYYDLNDRDISWGIDDQMTRLSYHSREGADIYWGNTVGSVRWNHIFSNKIFSNTTIAYNTYSMNMGVAIKEVGKRDGLPYKDVYNLNYNSGINDIGARMDFDYTPSPSHLIKFGAEYIYHTFIPESIAGVEQTGETIDEVYKEIDTTYTFINNAKYRGNDLSVYVEDDFALGRRFTVNPGLRLTMFNTQGRTYFSAQPRASAKLIFDDMYIKTGYARMSQYVHLLSSAQVSLPLDLWVPITKDIKPVTSDQFSLGLYYNRIKGWEFSVEGYFKNMNNILEYKDGALLLGNSGGWENKVAMGKGRAYGAEFMAEKTAGKLTGWVAYTLAKSDRIFPDGSINNGERFPYKYDRRHNLNINLNWAVSKKVDLNATWSFATGGTTTIPLRKTGVLSPHGTYVITADHIGYRNNYRLPSSHRLNLGINLHNYRPKHEGIWSLGLYNAYNQMNPNFVFMDSAYEINPDTGEYSERRMLKKITVLPTLPFISYTYKF